MCQRAGTSFLFITFSGDDGNSSNSRRSWDWPCWCYDSSPLLQHVSSKATAIQLPSGTQVIIKEINRSSTRDVTVAILVEPNKEITCLSTFLCLLSENSNIKVQLTIKS